MEDVVYIVGQVFPIDGDFDSLSKQWEFSGVYTSKEKAIDSLAFYDEYVFVAEVDIDTPFPKETCSFKKAWYPKLESEPK